ncbi:MAG: hypothetical protein J6Y32_05300 [Bacteroidales bacterium]|nr:hypothetical protein [Bacteroidales bacterium]
MRLSKIHKKILFQAVPLIEALIEMKGTDISEEDIRGCLMQAFGDIRGYKIRQECEGRTDIVVYTSGERPVIKYELKTFFKPNELPQRIEGDIHEDFTKLQKSADNACCYFLFVASTQQLRKNTVRFINDYAQQGQGTAINVPGIMNEVSAIVKRSEIRDTFVIYSWRILP